MNYLPSPSLAGAVALVVLVLVVLWFRLSTGPTVSAQELVKRSIAAEQVRIQSVSQPVIYQKLRVKRHSSQPVRRETASWELWSDPARNRSRQRSGDGASFPDIVLPDSPAYPRILTDLQAVYRENQMDPNQPLSPVAFDAWRMLASNRKEAVTPLDLPDGQKAVKVVSEISNPVALNGILEGGLVMRTSDWHPVEQFLKVRTTEGIDEYEVTESDFKVLALSSLDPAFFAEPSLPSPQTPAAVFPAAPSLPLPSETDLQMAEIQAFYGVHRAKVCLGESVEIIRAREKIEVRGLVSSKAQQEELQAELERAPYVVLNIQTIEEAVKTGSAKSRIPASGQKGAGTVPGANIVVPPARLPIQSELERYFAQSEQAAPEKQNSNLRIAELSTEALTLARESLTQAWALKQLQDHLGAFRLEALPLQSKWLLETMVRDHVQALQSNLSRSRRLLVPVLSFILAEKNPEGTQPPVEPVAPSMLKDTNLQGAVINLLEKIQTMDRLTNGLLAGTELPAGDSGAALRELLLLYDGIGRRLQTMERDVLRDFTNRTAQLESKGK